jgi:hypothetical protein
MARIRTIKPEFWSSPDTASLDDPWARLLYIAMWNWADDKGRGTANPKELAGFAFPNDESISSADIRRMLGGIRRAFGVILYEVEGRPYYAIPSWDLHQKIDKRSAGRCPAPDEGKDWDPEPPDLRKQHIQTISSENPAESTPDPRRDLGAGSWNRGTGEQGKNPSCGPVDHVRPDRARQDHQPVTTGASNADLANRAVTTIIGNSRPPSIRKSLTQRAEMLLNQGIHGTDLTSGLVEWRNTPNARVTWLDYKVSDAISRREAKERPPHLAPVTELATSDQRFQRGRQIAEARRARRLAAEQQPPALPGAAS